MPSALPDRKTLLAIVLAGIAGETAFEAYAWLVAPHLFGASLQPANLVMALTARLTGLDLTYAQAFLIHLATGSVGFATFVHLVRRTIVANVWVSGLASGLLIWFLAQGVLAPAVGRTFMMGFGPYTQSSLIGHVGMMLIIAAVLRWRLD